MSKMRVIKGGYTMMGELEELRAKQSKEWCFVQDDSCHWYLIEAEHMDLFNGLAEIASDDDHPRFGAAARQFDEMFFKCRIDGGPQAYVFHEPEVRL